MLQTESELYLIMQAYDSPEEIERVVREQTVFQATMETKTSEDAVAASRQANQVVWDLVVRTSARAELSGKTSWIEEARALRQWNRIARRHEVLFDANQLNGTP